MRRDEKIADRHEYGCGRGLFPDLHCSCWDGPLVTPADLKARARDILHADSCRCVECSGLEER